MSDGFNPVSAALDVFHVVNDWCDAQPDTEDETVQENWEAARELAEWVAGQVAVVARLEGELTALRAEVAATRLSIRPTEHAESVKASTLRKRRQRERARALVTPESVTTRVTGHADVTPCHASVTPHFPLSDSPSPLSLFTEESAEEQEEETRKIESESTRSRDAVTPKVTGKRDMSREPKARKWTRVPADFAPSADAVTLAASLRVDLAAELAKFRDHEFAKPKTDADAAFRTWLRNAAQWGSARPGANGQQRPVRGAMAPVSTTFESDPDWDAIARGQGLV